MPTLSTSARFRLYFALQFGGIGILMPYLALYFGSIGLSGGQIGSLLALLPLVSFLVQPLWGLLTDVYHLHRKVLVLACFGLALSMVGFALTTDFRLLLAVTVLHSLMRAPVSFLGNSLALEFLERDSNRAAFGSLRLWGSIGFAVSSFGIGAWLVDRDISLIIPLYGLTYALLGLVALSLPDAEVHGKVRWQDGLKLIGRKPALTVFLLGALFIGATLGVVNNYLAVYLSDIDAAGWMIGTALAISAIFEVPLMARVPAFLRRWGLPLVFVGGVSLLTVRWLLYTVIQEPILVLPTQVLHSIGIMSLLVVGVVYVDQLLEAQWRASGQALYTAMLHGVGPSIGLLAAGFIYEGSGISLVWLTCFGLGVVGTLIFAGIVRRQPVEQVEANAGPL